MSAIRNAAERATEYDGGDDDSVDIDSYVDPDNPNTVVFLGSQGAQEWIDVDLWTLREVEQ